MIYILNKSENATPTYIVYSNFDCCLAFDFIAKLFITHKDLLHGYKMRFDLILWKQTHACCYMHFNGVRIMITSYLLSVKQTLIGQRPVNVTLPVIGPKCGQIYRGKFKM